MQVAGIEPAVESEWTELPPPPELVLTYGALSPIAEETRMQLSAYENDDQCVYWFIIYENLTRKYYKSAYNWLDRCYTAV